MLGYVRTDYARRALADAQRDVAVYAAWPEALSVEGIFLDEAPHVWDEKAEAFMRALGGTIRAAEGIRGDRMVCSFLLEGEGGGGLGMWSREALAAAAVFTFQIKPPASSHVLGGGGGGSCMSHQLLGVSQMGKGTSVADNHVQIIHNPGTIPDPRLPSADVTVVFEHDYAAWQGGRDVAVAELPKGLRDGYSLMVHSVPETVGMGRLLRGLSPVARYLFVTNKDVDYYESFGEDWRDFVEGVPG